MDFCVSFMKYHLQVKNYYKALLFCMFISCKLTAYAQEKRLTYQPVLWSSVHLSYNLKNDWNTTVILQDRHFLNTARLVQSLAIATVSKEVTSDIVLGQGFLWFNFHRPDESGDFYHRPEYRPFQYIKAKRAQHRWSLLSRFQLEERWIHKENKDGLQNGYRYLWRFRYLWKFSYQIIQFKHANYLAVALSEEPFLNAGKTVVSIFEQNRLSGSFIYKIKRWKITLGYMQWLFHSGNGAFDIRNSLQIGLNYKVH